MSDNRCFIPSARHLAVSVLAFAVLAACDGSGIPGGGSASATFDIDGSQGRWTLEPVPGEGEAEGDAQFRRHGVATGLLLRAQDAARTLELTGTFLGEPADPVFVALRVSYDDGEGNVFTRAPALDAQQDAGVEGIRWRRLELDHEAGTGRATVQIDVPVCADVYSGPLEYETVCHQVEGRFDTPLMHSSTLRLMR